MRNTADVTGDKPIVQLYSISDESTVYPLDTFYDIHGRKGEMLFFLSRTDYSFCPGQTFVICRYYRLIKSSHRNKNELIQ
jgi:hypothetical protein